MKLTNKKRLIARTLGVGVKRIHLDSSRLGEIKEAITRQDIIALLSSKAVIIKEKKGRRKIQSRKAKKLAGKHKKKIQNRKRNYIFLVRKLRAYVSGLKAANKITKNQYYELAKKIKSKNFRNLSQLKEAITKENEKNIGKQRK